MAATLSTPTEGWRINPAYTFTQAARLAGTSSQTVKRWLFGYDQPGHRMMPVFGREERSMAFVSFLQLAEIVVVAAFREKRITLERMRRAHRFASEHLGLEYPFASLKMKTDGQRVLIDFMEQEPGPSLLAISDSGQLTLLGAVAEVVSEFDFDPTWAARWFPVGDKAPIVVDPRMGAAKPTVRDRGVTVEAIYRRWKAGQSYQVIGREYKLPPTVVEEVLRFADKVAA